MVTMYLSALSGYYVLWSFGGSMETDSGKLYVSEFNSFSPLPMTISSSGHANQIPKHLLRGHFLPLLLCFALLCERGWPK